MSEPCKSQTTPWPSVECFARMTPRQRLPFLINGLLMALGVTHAIVLVARFMVWVTT